VETIFVTGFPGFIGKRLVLELCRCDPAARLILLVEASQLEAARAVLQELPRATIDLFVGDVGDMHLGLSGREYQRLIAETTVIFHLAAISAFGVPYEAARRVNVVGTRNMLELADECSRLRRFVHFSSCFVSGNRLGVIAEDELAEGQSFRNPYERTKFEAEQLVDAAKTRLPITILRPSIVVGDSRTGEIDRFEGPYYLGMLIVLSPLVMSMPLPGSGAAPLHVVPVDFVVQAACRLMNLAGAEGKTLHLVDPTPMSARRASKLIAEHAQKRTPHFTISARAANWVLRLPGVERMTRKHRAAISYADHLAIYSCRNTLDLLDPTPLRCPPLERFLDRLIDFAMVRWGRRAPEFHDEAEDPLDPSPD
jgi:thioester reductase-like protein